MDEPGDRAYYTRRQAEILALFDDHALAWRPYLVVLCGSDEADAILREARRKHEALIPQLPYIGGDENPMTRHLIRSTTSLALYQAMKAHGRTATETGHVVYQAVVERVGQLRPQSPQAPGAEELAQQKEAARRSQVRRYPADWVWEFVEGDGVEFDYGYDFSACATYRLYHAQGAGEFLPFYCYLDFATHRRPGWGFARAMTLAEGHGKCAFRFKKGGETRRGWPPPFLE